MAADESLNNQWLELLRVGTNSGETYTRDDLDKIVSDYAGRSESGDKAPIRLGTRDQRNPEVLGQN